MVTALYRRYRPENFAELIGQSQVTDPLRTALRADRVNHAYLFSGPRGCGKTTSARILARCLNCAQGPTDTPCGVCDSCVELARDGGGSLDVIEIDAASHNGVDDARDIRDRAVFAPARDRFKIFILDEAHMVTPQGFNALLKVVEEPPEHVKFIFATTEPDKVIGTIRSRTHHYPFRLVPPAQMLEYVQQLAESEGVAAAPGVLPLVVRAGGGSVRDTLSLLDQLMAGSESGGIEYERAGALRGYPPAARLHEGGGALGPRDGAAACAAVDRVVQTGQDPRRFVEDLLERLRDLIVVGATVEGASAVLRGVTPEELDRLVQQSHAFGAAELSRSADVVNRALTDMTGATSPRLHLELMIARVLVPEADETTRGALARVERLERRVGVDGAAGDAAHPARPVQTAVAPSAAPARGAGAAGQQAGVASSASQTAAAGPTATWSDPAAASAAWGAVAPDVLSTPAAPDPDASAAAPDGPAVGEPTATEPATPTAAHSAAWAQTPAVEGAVPPGAGAGSDGSASPVGPVSLQQMRDAWPEIVEAVEKARRTAWMVVVTASVQGYADEVLTLAFPSGHDVDEFKKPQGAGEGVSEYLRRAIQQVLGVRVKYIARVEGPADGPAPAAAAAVAPTEPAPPRDEPAPVVPGERAAPSYPAPESQAAPAPASAPAPVSASTAAAPAPRESRPASTSATAAASPPAPAEKRPTASPVTGWDVATIPQTPPPEPDEPEFITEEPPGGAPTVDATPPPSDAAPAAPSAPSAAAASASASAPAPAQGPSASQRRAAAGDPRRGIPAGSRYGEAVVREILGAQFIEEETIAPRVTPQRSE